MADNRKAGPSRPPKKRPLSKGPSRTASSRGPAPREPRYADDDAHLETRPVDPDDEFGIKSSADYEPPPRHRRVDTTRPDVVRPPREERPAVREPVSREPREAREVREPRESRELRDNRGPRPEPRGDNRNDNRPDSRNDSRIDSRQEQRPDNRRDNRHDEGHDDQHADAHDDHGDHHDESRPQSAPVSRPSAPVVGGLPPRPSDGYTVNVYFDRQSRQFMATALEVPEIKVNGRQAELVLEELLDRLDTHLDGLKSRGDRVPEAYQLRKTYPETLTLPVSQTLFRKLDVLSRQEKIAFEQLVTELLASGIERRFELPRAGGGGGQRPQQGGGGQGHSNENRGNQRHGNRDRGRGENRGNNRRFNEPMNSSGDNFMEYVRNLEKGGGTPGRGNWRKR